MFEYGAKYNSIYRVIHEERSILCEVIVSATVKNKLSIIMCLIFNCYRDRVFEYGAKYNSIYRVIHRERSILCEVIVSATVKNKLSIIMCLILNCYRDRVVWM